MMNLRDIGNMMENKIKKFLNRSVCIRFRYEKWCGITVTPFIMSTRIKDIIYAVGWKNLWRIRSIKFNRIFKAKYTLEAYNDLKVLGSINIENVLIDAMQEEMKQFREREKMREDLKIMRGIANGKN